MSAKFTKDQLLEIWRRDMDPGYTVPLETEDGGRGLDPIAAAAAVLERVSAAVLASTQALYLRPHSTQLAAPASGGVRASGVVDVYRGRTTGNYVFLDTGDRLRADWVGVDGEPLQYPEYEVTQDYLFTDSSAGPFPVDVRAVREGFHGNVPLGTPGHFVDNGQTAIVVDHSAQSGGSLHVFADTAVGNRFLATMAGQWFRFTSGPNNGVARRIDFVDTDDEITLDDSGTLLATGAATGEVVSVGQVNDLRVVFKTGFTDGRSAELDLLARERSGQGRALGEGDEDFRERITTLPDAISPNAIIRAAARVMAPVDVPFQYVEVFGRGVGFFYSGTTGPTNAKNFYDDPKSYRKGRFYSAGPSGGTFPLGFLIVVDGGRLALLPDADAIVNALIHAVLNVKGAAVPWAIAFEPPL